MQKYILMLEEDQDDQFLTQEILSELALGLDIRFVETSQAFFNRLCIHPLPELILIDYNSVPEDALSILKKLKSNQSWMHIPAVVLSDNDLPTYRLACYQAGASSYIRKPSNMQQTCQKIRTFFTYWFDVVIL